MLALQPNGIGNQGSDLPPIKRTSKPNKEMSHAEEQSTEENLEI